MPLSTSGLPGPGTLLDPLFLRERLAAIDDARGTLERVTPFYLRWKPGTSALLGLRLTWRTDDGEVETLASLYMGDGVSEAAAKAATLRLLEPAMGPARVAVDDALFLAFPNDRLLKGLSAVADERRVGNRLGQPDGDFASRGLRIKARGSQVRPVRWKPGRRAVIELDLKLVNDATGARERWHAYARVMPADELAARVERWRAAAAVPALHAPEVVFVDAERGWFAVAAAEGRALEAPPSHGARTALGRAFTALHAAPSPTLATRTAENERIAAERALEALVVVAPDLEPRVAALRTSLARHAAALSAASLTFTHGDLGADQILVHGDAIAVIDWDEGVNGDPHFDWGSLLADLRGRGIASDWVEPLAREVLGERFDAARLAWQHAAHEARRAIEGLQRGRRDWLERALDTLAAAETVLATMPASAPILATPIGHALTALLDPARRFEVPGVAANASRVAAVWPEADGAIVRLEDPAHPGRVVRWLRLGDSIEAYDFPHDPALPHLAGLLADGGFTAAGHRWGKRAALRTAAGDRFLFLRPEAGLKKAWSRVTEAHRRLTEAGVPSSRPLGLAEGLPGWWAEAIPGRTIDPAHEAAEVWAALGEQLQRVHATATGEPAPSHGLATAVAAGRKQVALVRMADPALADELDRDLDVAAAMADTSGRAAWIHGDLHPLQILVGKALVVLDWERGRLGEAEEDLGNFLAHLMWEAPAAAPAAWAAFRQGYARAGGVCDERLLNAHACASLARVRAVHGWRDGSHARARDTQGWTRWREERS